MERLSVALPGSSVSATRDAIQGIAQARRKRPCDWQQDEETLKAA